MSWNYSMEEYSYLHANVIIDFTSNLFKGAFTNYVDKFLAFFDHLPPYVDIFYGMNVDKKWTFLDHLPTSSCKRSLWTTPYLDTSIVNWHSYIILYK